MVLKKPGELFEEKIEVETSIDETPVEVEEVQEQTDSVSSSFASSLSEAIDKNLNLLSEEYSEKLNKFNHKIDTLKEEINIKLNVIEKSNQSLKGEIGLVEHRQQTNNFDKIKNEVLSEIKKLEDKIEIIKEAYEEHILNEGLLNEPPSTDNEDPLTALDQKFVTLDKFEEHYKLFVNRIQKQLSTLGGGGAVNIKDMDDVDQSSARVNNKYLKYDSSSKKWVGADASGGGSGITTEFVSAQTLNVVGLSTHRNGINVAGLSYLDGDVSFVGSNTNALWDESKSDLVLYNDTRLTLGSNEDFQMWHGGTHTFIKNTGGDLRIRGDVIKLAREDSTETYLQATKNEDVKLFFNGVEKFATTLDGISVTGLTTTTNLIVAGVTTHHQDVQFPGAAYNILWDQATSKFKFDDNAQCVFGSASGGDLKIFHQSGNSSIRNETGQFRIAGNDIRIQTQNHSEDYILCTDGGAVQLFYNDVEKLATTNAGIDITGHLDVSDSIFVANNIKHLGDTDTYIEFNADKFRFITGGKSFLDITQSGASSVVINDQTDYDCDFRVEGLADEHLIFTDAATDRVGIGSAIPRAKLDVNGDVYVGTSQAKGVVLTSPNGTKYRLVVADNGTLSTTAV